MTGPFSFSGRLPACIGGPLLGTLTLCLILAGPAAATSLSVQTSPAGTILLNGGAPGVLTATPQITVSGGVTPYAYAWTAPLGSVAWISNATSATPSISAVVNWGDNFTETWTVNVTALDGAVGTGSVTINFAAPSADGVPDAANRVPIRGRITQYTLTTALPVAQPTYPIQVYVPADYAATSDPLPVIYATDGGPMSGAPSYAWEFSDMVRIIEVQHLRIIVVGIGGTETRNTDYLLPGADSFYTFITTEMIPFVESQYDVDPAARTLSGHSYGGLFAGNVFLKERPGTRFFSNYIALDGSFWVNPTENTILEQALHTATGGSLPNTALVLSSATGGNNTSVTQFYQQMAALNFQGLQLSRVPNFNTSHLQMFDEAFAASLELVSPNLPGSFTPPAITVQPQGATIVAGFVFNLRVTAIGGGLVYQWLKDGTAVPGATGSVYSVPSAASSDAGLYTVSVKNRTGTITSDAVTITVTTPTPITATPGSSGGNSGGGGGAFSPGFLVILAVLALARRASRSAA
jgi:hypothetical protein